MANFIGMVFATLKEEGIDTKGMSTDEAVAKFKELQKSSGGKEGETEGTPAEQRKVAEMTQSRKQEVVKETKKEENENNTKPQHTRKSRGTDKYGNELIDQETFNSGVNDVRKYISYMAKYGNTPEKMKNNRIYMDALSDYASSGIYRQYYDVDKNDNSSMPDVYTQDIVDIISEATGYNVAVDDRGDYHLTTKIKDVNYGEAPDELPEVHKPWAEN